MTGNESATFQERLNELCDENSSPLMRSDPRALDEYRRNKSAYKGWRDVVAENIDDLRDFTRMREELTELETESERLQEDLSDHQNKVDDLKHTLTDSQPEVDELRELFDFAKRVSNDANRIADKRIEVQTKKVDMNATHSYAGRDLRTVEREMTTRMEEKDTLISRINKLNKESSALNNSISNLSTQVRSNLQRPLHRSSIVDAF
jgi:chromosome segregation ATPase